MKMDILKIPGSKVQSTLFVIGFALILYPVSGFCPPLCSCDDGNFFIDCSEARNLKMVPIFLNPLTKFLSLAQNQIREISMSLQFYSELNSLDFSQNQIESLGENNFENLKNLKTLNISYNGIRRLQNYGFTGLNHVTVIDMSVNQIENIQNEAFENLLNLRELYLDRNRLEEIDWDIFQNLQGLERLSLRFNFIRILQPPLSLSPLFGIKTPQNPPNEKLSSTIPLWLNSTQNLWNLKLTELDLSWNQLGIIRNFALSPIMSSLRNLNLCCNYIHTIEDHAFQILNPKFNGNLEILDFSQNRLTTVPIIAFQPLRSSLAELDLSSNRISHGLPPLSFPFLSQLRIIKVSENPGIGTIDPTALLDNPKLVLFEANHLSNLTEFPVGLLDNKPNLHHLSLQFGQIRNLPEELFTNPIYRPLVSRLNLFGNPIDCNCSAWRLFEYVLREENLSPVTSAQKRQQRLDESQQHQPQAVILKNIGQSSSSLGSLQCITPSHLQQFLIRDLSESDFSHCFPHPPLTGDHFLLLVISLAGFIIFLIFIVIGIKLCCIYGLCPSQKEHKNPNGFSNDKDGTTTLDEFCSNVGVCGGTAPSVSTSTSEGKTLSSNDYRNPTTEYYNPPPTPLPISPALSSKSKPTTPLPNGTGKISNGRNSTRPTPRNGTTTLGTRATIPYEEYEDEERYYQKPTTITTPPRQNNKLRFNPQMELVLERSETELPYHHHYVPPHGPPPPPPPHHPLVLQYEYDNYPEYNRRFIGSPSSQHQRSPKQVPSVLV